MDSGYYVAYSGLLARTEALDSAASNLANAGTTGFRAEREYFQGAISGAGAAESQMGATLNSFGVLGGNRVDLGQGQLSPTGNPLDLAIQGSGFFAVMLPGGIRYTRDGAFQRTAAGALETQGGGTVLSAAGKPLLLPPGEVSIGADGAVSVNGDITGQLGIYDLSSDELEPEGTDTYRNLGKPPRLSPSSSVRQRYLEASNQDVIQGSLQLLLVQRQAEMMQKALTIFQGGFDKTASEDLPKV
jgi:flagellar basal-body rod protein FlgF/flagellar basal-body rod protein FlgG